MVFRVGAQRHICERFLGDILQYRATQYVDGAPGDVEDALVEEQSLQIGINDRPFTLTMRTPGDDRCLVAGLLLTEKIISKRGDIVSFAERACKRASHLSYADVTLAEELAEHAELTKRSMISSASCGLCGKADEKGLNYPVEPLKHQLQLNIAQLALMQRVMARQQTLFQETGGCHAAAAFTIQGELLCVMEDIGRHNAVDKAIGYLLLSDRLQRADLISVSGRVSYEIVTKLHTAGIPFLASVSAPSSLAVDVCREMGITLLSFCRGNRATVYAHGHTVVGASQTVG